MAVKINLTLTPKSYRHQLKLCDVLGEYHKFLQDDANFTPSPGGRLDMSRHMTWSQRACIRVASALVWLACVVMGIGIKRMQPQQTPQMQA